MGILRAIARGILVVILGGILMVTAILVVDQVLTYGLRALVSNFI